MLHEVDKYIEGNLIMPCVVDTIEYEKQIVLDIVQDKTMMFKKGDEIKYLHHHVVIHKKMKDYPIQTEHNLENRLDIRKVRYFCNKILNNEQVTT